MVVRFLLSVDKGIRNEEGYNPRCRGAARLSSGGLSLDSLPASSTSVACPNPDELGALWPQSPGRARGRSRAAETQNSFAPYRRFGSEGLGGLRHTGRGRPDFTARS